MEKEYEYYKPETSGYIIKEGKAVQFVNFTFQPDENGVYILPEGFNPAKLSQGRGKCHVLQI